MAVNDKLLSYMRDHSPRLRDVTAKGQGIESPSEEGSCPAFGFLRGLNARALAVEFRSRTGNSCWFAYSCLVWWRFNPSAGLLLKFATGDGVSLVLIHGSNLDAPVGGGSVILTNRGLQRHRILWVREMDEDEWRARRRWTGSMWRIPSRRRTCESGSASGHRYLSACRSWGNDERATCAPASRTDRTTEICQPMEEPEIIQRKHLTF